MSEITVKRHQDPRVQRTRAAAMEAATRLFLQDGFAATTMDDIAAEAGLTKRTLYNNYASKAALFEATVMDMVRYAQAFARNLDETFFARVAQDPKATLQELAQRHATAIIRPPVIALRRLLISEASTFPDLAADYYDRVPGGVLDALTAGFDHVRKARVLRIDDPRMAAEHFAYLIAGALLDKAVLLGRTPSADQVSAHAKAGAETFLAAYQR